MYQYDDILYLFRESSLKDTSTGTGVWHPPFIVTLAITVPKMKTKSSGTLLRQKDVYISVENYDIKGKKKILAKARLNLSDYIESAAETDVSFRHKLHPESSKISSASIELTIRKSVQDPTKRTDNPVPGHPIWDDDEKEDTKSLGSINVLSIPSANSTPGGSIFEEEEEGPKLPNYEKSTDIITIPPKPEVNRPKEIIEDPKLVIVPNHVTPPPLPPRGRTISEDSPPTFKNPLAPKVTSTPLPNNGKNKPSHLPLNTTVKKENVNSQKGIRKITPSSITVWGTDTDDEDDNNKKREEDAGSFLNPISVSTNASPKIMKTNGKIKSSAEQDLIEWAKKTLACTPQVKVTNLTTSWSNGLGFCAILHKSYPNLIPFSDLASKSDNALDNNELAFDAADLILVDTKAMRQMTPPPKADVSAFLHELRSRIEDAEPPEEDSEAVIEYKKKWYSRGKYFKKEVAHLVKCEKTLIPTVSEIELSRLVSVESTEESIVEQPKVDEQPKVEEFIQTNEVVAVPEDDSKDKTSSRSTVDEKKEPIKTNEVVPNDQIQASSGSTVTSPLNSESSTPRRERVKVLIAQAHQDSSSTDTEFYIGTEDHSTPSSISEVVGGPLCESITILEELSQLNREENEIHDAIKNLEEDLREKNLDGDCDELEFEAMMQKYASLVNEKNSMVRRQMQLNLAEKERAIEHKKELLQQKLQKFSDLDDSQKTEDMRLKEEELLKEYVEAVNAKNELVHDLDSQEKLIAEDERIKSFIANPNQILTKPGHTKHNIMDEFFDFFKQAASKK